MEGRHKILLVLQASKPASQQALNLLGFAGKAGGGQPNFNVFSLGVIELDIVSKKGSSVERTYHLTTMHISHLVLRPTVFWWAEPGGADNLKVSGAKRPI